MSIEACASIICPSKMLSIPHESCFPSMLNSVVVVLLTSISSISLRSPADTRVWRARRKLRHAYPHEWKVRWASLNNSRHGKTERGDYRNKELLFLSGIVPDHTAEIAHTFNSILSIANRRSMVYSPELIPCYRYRTPYHYSNGAK